MKVIVSQIEYMKIIKLMLPKKKIMLLQINFTSIAIWGGCLTAFVNLIVFIISYYSQSKKNVKNSKRLDKLVTELENIKAINTTLGKQHEEIRKQTFEMKEANLFKLEELKGLVVQVNELRNHTTEFKTSNNELRNIVKTLENKLEANQEIANIKGEEYKLKIRPRFLIIGQPLSKYGEYPFYQHFLEITLMNESEEAKIVSINTLTKEVDLSCRDIGKLIGKGDTLLIEIREKRKGERFNATFEIDVVFLDIKQNKYKSILSIDGEEQISISSPKEI